MNHSSIHSGLHPVTTANTRRFFQTALMAICALALPVEAAPGHNKHADWHPRHTVIVILENHSYQQLMNTPAMPYLSELAQFAAVMSNAHFGQTPYGVTLKGFDDPLPARPSQPNYLYLFSGNNQGVLPQWFRSEDSPYKGTAYQDAQGNILKKPAKHVAVGIGNRPIPASRLPFTTPNLGAAIIAAGHSFATFSEDLPYPHFSGISNSQPARRDDGYARRHNPASNWINFNQRSIAKDRQRFLIPVSSNLGFRATRDPVDGKRYRGFAEDAEGRPLDFSQLPSVSLVIPSNAHNAHTESRAKSDVWLQLNIADYAEWAKTHDSLLIITTDEDGSTDDEDGFGPVDKHLQRQERDAHGSYQYGADPIVTLFVGPPQRVIPGIYKERVNHLRLLATVLNFYGVLNAFRSDFEAAFCHRANPFRAAEGQREYEDLKPVESPFRQH